MKNYYSTLKVKNKLENPNYGIRHFIKLPFRIALIGSSGSGKSNALMNILSAFSKTFDRVVLVCQNLHEPLYEHLQQNSGVEFVEGMPPTINELIGEDAEAETSGAGACPTAEDKKYDNIFIIFDDMVGEKKANEIIAQYYKRARKVNISCCYLSQSYYDTPKFIRKQLNYVVLMGGLLARDLRMVIGEFNLGLEKKELIDLYNRITSEPLSAMFLDLMNSHPQRKRIASGLTNFVF